MSLEISVIRTCKKNCIFQKLNFIFSADNRKKTRRKEAQIKQDFSDFAKVGGGQQGTSAISPQMALATYQFLSTCNASIFENSFYLFIQNFKTR